MAKDMVKKHLLSILGLVSLVALALTFAKVSMSMDVAGYGSSSSSSITGFTAAKEGTFGFVLIVGPVLLIAMNYVKQLGKYKGLLTIAVPAVCLAVLVIVMLQAKNLVAASGSGGGGMVNVEVKTSIGTGGFVLAASYIATAVAGAVTYHNFTLDKAGLERLKHEGAVFIQSAQGKATETMQNFSSGTQSAPGTTPSEAPAARSSAASSPTSTPVSRPAPSKKTSASHADEILSLIERLAKMKNDGILTDEEFADKKKQLLLDL